VIKDAKSKHAAVKVNMTLNRTVGDVKVAVASSAEYKNECAGSIISVSVCINV
jgi:hypothetical protein